MGGYEMTESALAAAAGTRSFGQGESLVPAVRGLRTTESRAAGGSQGRSVYAVELTWDQGSTGDSSTCPHAARGNFCKHMVALGLAALDGEMRVPIPHPHSRPSIAIWRRFDQARLRALVQEMAGFSDAATRALEVGAAGAGGDTSAVSDELVAAVRDALAVRGFVDYRRSFEVAGDAQRLPAGLRDSSGRRWRRHRAPGPAARPDPRLRMPGWLQAFANNQPVTFVINAMRALAIGGPVEANLLKSIAWIAGIFIVFAPLAVRAYKRAA